MPQRSQVTLQVEMCEASYRYDLSTNSDGFMSSVAEIISIDGDGLSLPLVGPACIISTQQKWIHTLWVG